MNIDRGLPVLERQVSFDDIKTGEVPQDTDFWLGDVASARLRLRIVYEQNEVLKWDAEVNMLVGDIKSDAGIL